MALDESRENDESYEVDGLTFVVDKAFLAQASPIKIDYSMLGFEINSAYELPKGGDCGGCSGGTCG
ncbi:MULTISPECIES: hypothetical protein [Desulfatibacillum]|uniref:HesB-like selenoprotein n=1 Tax=Desulfatibacillum alkenivorans DSM 16219 TaxID=1121393 RepID=A0A1M6YDQ5_9BACT|nr:MULTISPECIES: hypothetical protein [Desulfatibacillum]SHL16368.1 hypothetical protein SAMN02745216_04737 [Desulfatibacillum alkenivorans DSM 16219]